MPAKKKTAKPKKKMVPPGPPIQQYDYFIDEVPTDLSTQEMQDVSKALGLQGWRLILIGQYSSTPNTVRIYYIREM